VGSLFKDSIFPYMQSGRSLLIHAEKLGFNKIKTETIHAVAEYATEDDYVQYIQGWLPC
jgi:hypothetical protein